jgi:chromosome partitioning protein
VKTLIFFNNKGGVGKTTLVYHVAHMLTDMGHRCLAVDLDPQTNLTTMCLPIDELERIYDVNGDRATIMAGIRALTKGTGDIQPVEIQEVRSGFGLLAGDLALSMFEDKLSDNWGKTLDGDESAFRITSAFFRIIHAEGDRFKADYCLVDIGPNFGAINRATLIAADYLVVPMGSDLFSLQGIRNLGDQFNDWKKAWAKRKAENPDPTLELPEGNVAPLGYVLMQHGVRESKQVAAYRNWANRIPSDFQQHVLGMPPTQPPPTVEEDPNCLALLKHYRSLAPMAMEARKPMFHLKPADGAIGAHTYAVQRVYSDFKALTERLVDKMR